MICYYDAKYSPAYGNAFDVMYINHYVVKSVEDYREKQLRGCGDGAKVFYLPIPFQ